MTSTSAARRSSLQCRWVVKRGNDYLDAWFRGEWRTSLVLSQRDATKFTLKSARKWVTKVGGRVVRLVPRKVKP